MKLTIDANKKYQIFERFGASGAWWAQIVGGWSHIDEQSNMAVRDRISQLLYSKENGIGLGIYRYNLGGGSKLSGKGKYSEPARRAESFDTADGSYDWSRDENAVYMMKKAVADGADEVIFFVNSPPESMTKNGMSHCSGTTVLTGNLSPENYDKFAKYCLDVTEHFVDEGVPVKYLSPINEPLWIWNGGQEGCHYGPCATKKVLKVFARELESREKLKGIKLSGAENGDLRWFNKAYTHAVLSDPIVRRNVESVDYHSYFLRDNMLIFNNKLFNRVAFLKRYRKWMDRHYPGIAVKMSEWTHMQGGRDKGMDSALVAAKTIYEDISILNVTSWQHWIAVSEVDYCDGLIYINLDDKTFETTKRLYITGNFSKYIIPGSQRIEASCEDNELKVLAFLKDDATTAIVINETTKEKSLSVQSNKDKILTALTDISNDLTEAELSPSKNVVIPPRSVTTIVF